MPFDIDEPEELLAVVGHEPMTSWTPRERVQRSRDRLAPVTNAGLERRAQAQRRQVLGLVLRESAWVCLAGFVIGLPAAIGASRWLASLLYNVAPNDAATFVGAAVGMLTVALAASLVPALRAASISPIVALRNE